MKLVLPENPGDFVFYTRCLAGARGEHANARARAEAAGNVRVAELLRIPNLGARVKDLVASGSTAELSQPLREYLLMGNSFLEWTRSAFDVLVGVTQAVRVGFGRIGIVTISAGSGGVGESAPKPVSAISLAGDDLPITKVVLITVADEELFRMTGQALLATELRDGLAAETDREFLARIVDTGVPAIAASGVTAAAFLADLGAAVAALSIGERSRLFLIADPQTVAALALMPDGAGALAFPDVDATQGGSIGGVQITPSAAVERDSSGAILTLVDASKLAASRGGIVVDASRQALIEMQTAPANPPSAATVRNSLWQENKIGMKCERYFSVACLRDSAVATITGANYSSPLLPAPSGVASVTRQRDRAMATRGSSR